MAAEGLLPGRVAVLTGGGGGIGRGVCRRLVAEGAMVVVNDIDPDLLSETEAEVRAVGGFIRPVPGDIRDPATVEALVEAARAVADGRIDVLVNNVGDFRPNGMFLKSGPEDWEALYALNLGHVFACTRAIAPAMTERSSGSIVNVSTVEAFRGIPANAVYSAFNAGINAFTRSLAVELGRKGVRVNAIAPDLADTLQTPAEMMLAGRDEDLVRHWVPLGRFGHPDDYGDVVVFLASDLSRFVTGHVIPVDGGTLAAGGWYLKRNGPGWTNMPDSP
ncbi:MAG TPA: SDR family oxidoreductase [Acidimicrobiales bacterium]|jgi:NAD(P)-dependent dehydrogenase (short-subunit alcohol dehydrogenase family)|nr:SDR family oxidoreductase [Acidimicrobiales bacterium]